MNSKTVELYGLISLSVLTLVALLAYTFVHTGGLLSEYVNPWQVGYVAAFGVEAAIITMSIRIGKLLRHLARSRYKGLEGWMSLLWQGSTLLFVLAVSAAANVVEGHKVKYGLEMTLVTIQDLDTLQVAIGLLATGLIPVVVLSMTEIVSGEIKSALETEEHPATATVAAIESPQPVALPIAPLAVASLPKAQPAIEAPVKKQEPTLAEMLRHFKKTREEMLALLKRFNLMDATPEHVYNSVSRYFPMPGDLTKERFGVLLAELKATPTKPAPATNLLEKLIREEIAEAEEQPATGLSLRAQVYAILNKRGNLENEELYTLLPGKNQSSIRVNAGDWRRGEPLKKPKVAALSNGNGRH